MHEFMLDQSKIIFGNLNISYLLRLQMKFVFRLSLLLIFLLTSAFNFNPLGGSTPVLSPVNGELIISLSDVNDRKAHHYKAKADDGTMVTFFVLKSRDGVMRAAIDACDVCYRAGKGYYQDGDFMVCENCGMRFASTRINVVKGGCNPAPLTREVRGKNLVIQMKDINANKWYMKYRRK